LLDTTDNVAVAVHHFADARRTARDQSSTIAGIPGLNLAVGRTTVSRFGVAIVTLLLSGDDIPIPVDNGTNRRLSSIASPSILDRAVSSTTIGSIGVAVVTFFITDHHAIAINRLARNARGGASEARYNGAIDAAILCIQVGIARIAGFTGHDLAITIDGLANGWGRITTCKAVFELTGAGTTISIFGVAIIALLTGDDLAVTVDRNRRAFRPVRSCTRAFVSRSRATLAWI
jgi:hypothetical protein